MTKSFSDLLNESLQGKVVLVRVDFNVPIENGEITDNTRIRSSLPTINELIKRGAKVVLISHLSRPNGQVVDSLRLSPIRDNLETLLDCSVKKVDSCVGPLVTEALNDLNNSEVLLLENIRFYKEEMSNDPVFSKTLAGYADYFVQDAFGSVHRSHASTVGVAKFLPSFTGSLLDKEISYFEKILKDPKRPFTAIIGGSKISTKFSVLESLLNTVDVMVLGGAMVYTILKAQGYSVGRSLVEDDLLPDAGRFLERAKELNKTIYIPEDHQVVTAIDSPDSLRTIQSDEFSNQDIGVDIGYESIQKIASYIQQSQFVFWNGPVGIFETKAFSLGTLSIAETLAKSDAVTIVGGGDSVAALNQSGFAQDVDHISTGGGASLEFLEGKVLPGISVLQ